MTPVHRAEQSNERRNSEEAPQTWHYGLVAKWWSEFNDDFRPHEIPYFQKFIEGNPKIQKFDASCFDGQYITGDVDECYLNKIEQARNDLSKVKSQAVSAIIDLYND